MLHTHTHLFLLVHSDTKINNILISGWVILSKDNGSLLPMSVSAVHLLAGLTTYRISAKCKRQHRKLGLVFFKVMIIYSSCL